MSRFLQDDAIGKLVIRLTVGILMLFHGVAKILHPDSLGFIRTMLESNNMPAMLAYGVYVGEIIAPLMLIVGVFSRIGGLIITVNMVFAIWLAHTKDIYSLTQHGGWALELQAFYLFCGFAIIFLGSGRYAVKPD